MGKLKQKIQQVPVADFDWNDVLNTDSVEVVTEEKPVEEKKIAQKTNTPRPIWDKVPFKQQPVREDALIKPVVGKTVKEEVLLDTTTDSKKPYTPVQSVDAFSPANPELYGTQENFVNQFDKQEPTEQPEVKQPTLEEGLSGRIPQPQIEGFTAPDTNTPNQSLYDVAPEFVKGLQEKDKKEYERQVLNQKLHKSILEEAKKNNTLTGISNQQMLDLERIGKIDDFKNKPLWKQSIDNIYNTFEANRQTIERGLNGLSGEGLMNILTLGAGDSIPNNSKLSDKGQEFLEGVTDITLGTVSTGLSTVMSPMILSEPVAKQMGKELGIITGSEEAGKYAGEFLPFLTMPNPLVFFAASKGSEYATNKVMEVVENQNISDENKERILSSVGLGSFILAHRLLNKAIKITPRLVKSTIERAKSELDINNWNDPVFNQKSNLNGSQRYEKVLKRPLNEREKKLLENFENLANPEKNNNANERRVAYLKLKQLEQKAGVEYVDTYKELYGEEAAAGIKPEEVKPSDIKPPEAPPEAPISPEAPRGPITTPPSASPEVVPPVENNAVKNIANQMIEQVKLDEIKQQQELQKQQQKELEIGQKQKEKQQEKFGQDSYAQVNAQVQNAIRNKKLIDERSIAKVNEKIESTKYQPKFEDLYNKALEHNKKINEQLKIDKDLELNTFVEKTFGRTLDKLTPQQKQYVDKNFKSKLPEPETVTPKIKALEEKPQPESKAEPEQKSVQKTGDDKGIIPASSSVVKEEKKVEVPKVEKQPEKISKGSTQVNIPKEQAKPFIDFSNSIPDKEIYKEGDKYGREVEPHVTALYGLTKSGKADVEKAVKEFGDVELELGKTSLFEQEKFDVLKVDIKSDDLNKLNKLLKDNLEYENDFPNYEPHLTIAYLNKGEGKKYIDDNRFEGQKLKLSELMYSDPTEKKTPISLSKQPEKSKEVIKDGQEKAKVLKPKGEGKPSPEIKVEKSENLPSDNIRKELLSKPNIKVDTDDFEPANINDVAEQEYFTYVKETPNAKIMTEIWTDESIEGLKRKYGEFDETDKTELQNILDKHFVPRMEQLAKDEKFQNVKHKLDYDEENDSFYSHLIFKKTKPEPKVEKPKVEPKPKVEKPEPKKEVPAVVDKLDENRQKAFDIFSKNVKVSEKKVADEIFGKDHKRPDLEQVKIWKAEFKKENKVVKPEIEKPKKEYQSFKEALYDYIQTNGKIMPTAALPTKSLNAMGLINLQLNKTKGANPETIFSQIAPQLWEAKYGNKEAGEVPSQSKMFEELMLEAPSGEARRKYLDEIKPKKKPVIKEKDELDVKYEGQKKAFTRLDKVVLNDKYVDSKGNLQEDKVLADTKNILKEAKTDLETLNYWINSRLLRNGGDADDIVFENQAKFGVDRIKEKESQDYDLRPLVNKIEQIELFGKKKVGLGIEKFKGKLIEQMKNDIMNQNPLRTVFIELMQNAIDSKSKKISVRYGQRTEWLTDEKRNKYSSYLEVKDAGIGMSPEEVENQFLQLANEGIKGAEEVGGYGFAKVAFLMYPDQITLETIKDGVKTTFTATPKDLLEETVEPIITKVKEPNGTTVSVALPEDTYAGDLGRKINDYIQASLRDVDIEVTESRREYRENRAEEIELQEEAIAEQQKTLDENRKFYSEDDILDNEATLFRMRERLQELKDSSKRGYDEPYPNETLTYNKGKEFKEAKRAFPDIKLERDGNEFIVSFPETTVKARQTYDQNGYYLTTTLTNKGVPLDIGLSDEILRDEPNYHVVVNFTKTVEPKSEKYPFLKNRTVLRDEFRRDIEKKVRDITRELNSTSFQKDKKKLIEDIKNAPKIGNTKVVMTGISKESQADFLKEIKTFERLSNDVAEIIELFQAQMQLTNHPDLRIMLSFDPSSGGWMPTKELRQDPDVGDMFAVNPFYAYKHYIDQSLSNANYSDEGAKKAAAFLTHSLVHEYGHLYGGNYSGGHDQDFAYAVGSMYSELTHEFLAMIERKFYDNIFKTQRDEFRRMSDVIREFYESGRKRGSIPKVSAIQSGLVSTRVQPIRSGDEATFTGEAAKRYGQLKGNSGELSNAGIGMKPDELTKHIKKGKQGKTKTVEYGGKEYQVSYDNQEAFGREGDSDLTKLKDYKKHLELSLPLLEEKYRSFWEEDGGGQLDIINKLDYSKTSAVKKYRDKLDVYYADPVGMQIIDARLELAKTDRAIKEIQSKIKKAPELKGQENLFGDEPALPEPKPIKTKVLKSKSEDLNLFGEKQGYRRSYEDLKRIFDNEERITRNRISRELNSAKRSDVNPESKLQYKPEWEEGVPFAKNLVAGVWDATGRLDVIGLQLGHRYWEDIADIWYIDRNIKVEVGNFIGLDDNNKVVTNTVYTSNAANYIKTEPEAVRAIAQRYKAMGVTKVVGKHNHPSGNPEPSNNDLGVAVRDLKIFKEYGIEYTHSVVINGDKYSYFTPDETKYNIDPKDGKPLYYAKTNMLPYRNPSKHPNQEFLDAFDKAEERISLDDPEKNAELFSHLRTGKGVCAIVMADNMLKLRGYEYVTANMVNDPERLKAHVEKLLKGYGGSTFFIVGDNADLGIDIGKVYPHPKMEGAFVSDKLKTIALPFSHRAYMATTTYSNGAHLTVVEYIHDKRFEEAEVLFEGKKNLGKEKPQAQVGGSPMGKQAYKAIVKSGFTDSDLNDVKRLRTIGKNLATNFGYEMGKDIRAGLVKRFVRKARGLYFPQSGIIRINTPADLTAVSHEFGHRLDHEIFYATRDIKFDRTPEGREIVMAAGRKDAAMRARLLNNLRRKYGNNVVDTILEKYELRQELKKMLEDEKFPVGSYSASQLLPEGIAEYVRNYVMNPDFARQSAPRFSQMFDDLLSQSPETKRVLDAAQEQFKEYSEQDPRQITESTIARNTEEDGFLEKIKQAGKDFYVNVIDGTEPFRALERELLKREPNLRGDKNPLLQVLSLFGGDGKAEQYLYYGPFQRNGNQIEFLNDVKPLFKILKPILEEGSLKRHEGYLIAMRNVELHNNGLSGAATTSKDVAIKTLKLYKDTQGEAYWKQFREDMYAYQNALLDYYYKSGKLSTEVYDKIKETNKYYVPFKRFFDEYESTGQSPDVAKFIKDSSPSPVKKIKGTEREVVSPIGSMIKNSFDLILSADRNDALKVIVESLKKLDPRLVQEVPRTSVTGKMGTDGSVKWVFANDKPMNEHIISVWEDGKQKFYQIPKEYYDSFFAISTNYDKAIQLLSLPSRLLQAGAVQLDPTFAVRNIPRDQFSATIFYSKYGYNPFWFLKGFSSFAKKDFSYQNFLASGADQSFLTAVDQQLGQKYIDKKAGKNITTRTQEYLRNPLKIFQDINRISELGTRIGGFRNAYRKSKDVYKAMQEARDISADYAVKGLSMRNISPMYPFLNARTQHMRSQTSAFKNRPKQTIIKGLLYVSSFALLNWLRNNLDEEDRAIYNELPEWRKIFFWNIRIPFTDTFLPIPKELASTMFGTSVEYGLDHLVNNNIMSTKEIGNALVNNYSPITNEMELVPQFVRPIAEQFANKVAFSGQRIVPRSLENLPAEMQYDDQTSHTIKIVAGDWLGLSPKRVEALIRAYGGGFSTYPIAVEDELLELSGVAQPNPDDRFTVLGVNIKKMPIVKALLPTKPEGMSSYSGGKFFEKLDELEAINNSVNNFIKLEDSEGLNKYLSDKKRAEDYNWYLMPTENNETIQTQINRFKTTLKVAKNLKIDILKDPEIKNKTELIDEINVNLLRTAQEFKKAYDNKEIFILNDYMQEIYLLDKEENQRKREAKEELKEKLPNLIEGNNNEDNEEE